MYLFTNAHVLVPRYYAGLFGSFMKKFRLERDRSYFMKYFVRKNRVIKVDRKGQGCDREGEQEPVGLCIVSYLENTHDCTFNHLTADEAMPFCTMEKLSKMAKTLENWKVLPEADIINKTGCLPYCERDELSLDSIKETSSRNETSPSLTIALQFEDGSYKGRY